MKNRARDSRLNSRQLPKARIKFWVLLSSLSAAPLAASAQGLEVQIYNACLEVSSTGNVGGQNLKEHSAEELNAAAVAIQDYSEALCQCVSDHVGEHSSPQAKEIALKLFKKGPSYFTPSEFASFNEAGGLDAYMRPCSDEARISTQLDQRLKRAEQK